MEERLVENGRYHGFTLVSRRDGLDGGATGYLFRHDSTGFEVYYLEKDNPESFFSYNVHTPPFDNSGVFHIIEHTVLTGSRKYPVRDPFMALARSSCNTFLNAMTGPDRTNYPAASPLREDFDNIWSIYTDALFCPLLRKEDFMQEGIRLRKNGRRIEAEGVVFSEMLGDAYTHETVVHEASVRSLFPSGSPYCYESGGLPEDICLLTYESFLETFHRYYVPRNMNLFLFGKLDMLEKLEILHREYLEGRDPGEKAERAGRALKDGVGRFASMESMADEDAGGASIMVSWAMGDADDPEENTILSLVVSMLLSDPGCPLYRKITGSSIGRDINNESGMCDSYRSLVFSIGFSGSSPEKKDEAEAFILSALEDAAVNGLTETVVEAALRRTEFRLQEIPDGLPEGYRIFFTRIDKGWAYGRDPSDMLQVGAIIRKIRKRLLSSPSFFSDWIMERIVRNPDRLLSVTSMDEKMEERMWKGIRRNTALRKGDWREEDEEAYLRFQALPDSPEALLSLPRLPLSSIPSDIRRIPREEHSNLLVTETVTDGIVYGDFIFDISDFSLEELQYASLLTRLLSMSDVDGVPYEEFMSRLRFATGAFSFQMEIGSDCSGREHDALLVRFKSLSDYFSEALELLSSLFLKGDFSSSEHVGAALRNISGNYEVSIMEQADSYAMGSSSRSLSAALQSTEYTQGLEFWFKVRELEKDADKTGRVVSALAKRIFTSSRIVFHLTLDSASRERGVKEAESFISSFPGGGKVVPVSHAILPESRKDLAFIIPSSLSFTSLSARALEEENPLLSPLRLLLEIVGENSLWNAVREKGGAYGCGSGVDVGEDIMFFYTYRDPRLDASVEDFRKCVLQEEITEEKLEDAKLRVLSMDIKPMGPQTMGIVDLRRWIYGVTDEIRERMKKEQLEATLSLLEEARDNAVSLMEKGRITVLAGRKALRASSLPLEKRRLPFS